MNKRNFKGWWGGEGKGEEGVREGGKSLKRLTR